MFYAWILARLFAAYMDWTGISRCLRWTAPAVLWVCVLAVLLHPLISYYSMNNVHPFSFDMLMFYLPLLLTARYFHRGSRTMDLVLLGVLTGLVLLTRTVLIVNLLPFVTIAATRSDWRSTLRRTAFVLLTALLVSGPWLIRNYVLDGIVGYTSTTGEILWKGSLGNSDGSNVLSDGRTYTADLSDRDRQILYALSVAGQNRFFLQRYFETLRSKPSQVMRMFVVKLKNFFWFRTLIGNDYTVSIRRFIPLYEVTYAAVLLLALLSIPRVGWPSLFVWSVIVGLGLFQSVFYVETRHRVVIEPLLIFLAVLSMATILGPAPDT